MATIATSPSPVQLSYAAPIPPLQNGDHLTLEEFERRYDAMPELKKAELIEGVVYMPPPVSDEWHSFPNADFATILGMYRALTPGVRAADNGFVRMDVKNFPQPDLFVMVLPSHGGSARIDKKGYVVGAPELTVEIAASSASYDLHEKLTVYLRNGVREYIVWRTYDKALDYFILRGNEYARHTSDEQGRYQSIVFPGLWLDSVNLLKGDLATVLKFVQEGIASPEHAEFVAKLQSASQSK